MKKILGITLGLILIAALAITAAGAAWSQATTAVTNPIQAATFGMTVGDGGTQEAHGFCGATNLAPGDPAIVCNIPLHNTGSIPINVVWSGFKVDGDQVLEDNLIVTDFADSTGSTHLSDIMGFDTNGDGKLSLAEAAFPLNNGYFSNGGDTHAIFIAPHSSGWVQITLAFSALAGNDTIGTQIRSITWYLTAMQTPVNSAP